MSATRVGLFALLCVVAAGAVPPGLGATAATAATAAAAPAPAPAPAPNCGGGADGGVYYTTDSGLTVVDNSDTGRPAGGPFVNGTTLRVGNLTLSAEGDASLHVTNATAPTVCLAAVNATSVPVRVAIDDGPTIRVAGRAETLSVGTVTFDRATAGAALAYTATDSLTVRVTATGLPPGATVRAVETGSEDALTTGTVAANGTLPLTPPDGTAAVSFVPVPATTTSATAVTARSTTKATTSISATTVTAETATKATTVASATTVTAETATETTSPGMPGFRAVGALAGLAAAVVIRYRR
jgi:hypothetical protein